MNVLVTGANGFTGSHLACALASLGHKVRGIVRPDADLSQLAGAEEVELVEASIAHEENLAAHLADIDVVYHVAAAYRRENIPVSEFFDVNGQGCHC